jgi:hypothetical protein
MSVSRRSRSIAQLTLVSLTIAACAAQSAPAPVPAPVAIAVPTGTARVIRRDIPMTNMIRRAHAAGTRDSTGRPGRNYWQQWVEYTINARLDAPTSTITGRETILLRNNSDSALRNIVLRLDQNIFAPNAARATPHPSTIEQTQGTKITRMIVNGQSVNLTPPQPGRGGNPAASGPVAFNLDNTVAFVALQNAIAAKGSATIEIDWSFKVPNVSQGRGLRMGRQADSVYQLAQWYPRVTVYDDLKGWDTDPYLGNSEFYNNFGRFDVSIDVPAGWLVGATGVLQNRDAVLSATTRERLSRVLESDETRTIVGPNEMGAGRATTAGDANGRLVWRFVADSVNDFAWATSRSYVWDATRATIPGRGPIPVHLLYMPGDSGQFKPAAPVSRHALEFYSRLWMPYAYPQLTLADGPELGMEYPMFLMSAVGAADHEVGHEWWPMMVSNNETWYGWMDEGFNQYMNVLSGAARRNQPAMLDGPGQSYGSISGNELESPMMWPANYQAPQFYGFTTYGKAPLMLSMLGGIVGDTAVQRAMGEWARAWRFKHPSPWDYMFYMNNALGRDLGWFWYYWLFTTDAVHGSIQNVATTGNQTTVTVQQDGQMPSPVVLRVEFAPTGPPIAAMANSRMMDSATAIVSYPVDVWFGGSRTFNATLDFGGRTIQRITLDPFRRFADRDLRDNVWPRQ